MKIVFSKAKADAAGWKYPGLTDRKEYDVIESIECEETGEAKFYLIIDDDEDDLFPIPYEVEVF